MTIKRCLHIIRSTLVLFILLWHSGNLFSLETTLTAEKELNQGILSGLQLTGGKLELYRFEDSFSSDTRENYTITGEASFPEDEYGVMDPGDDAALVTHQTRPDNCLFIETRDNDTVTIKRDIVPTVKGYFSFDFWPTMLWPTSGKISANVRENGSRQINYTLAGSDYTNPTTKTYDGDTLSARGGRPYFSSISKFDIYSPSEIIPKSEQRWWNMRLLFRPAYVAGSLDGSVCREIEDPKRRKIKVIKFEIVIQQLETYIRAIRFKALLGETVSSPIERTSTRWITVRWDGIAPENTRIGLQIRAADDVKSLKEALWSGPDAKNPYYLKPGNVPDALATKKFIQIKVILKATIDAGFLVSPTLSSVTVRQAEASE